MSLNAATIEILIAKGLSAADILDVARATEVKKDATNAERQARHRAKRKSESNAVIVTGVAPPNDIYSNPPEAKPEPSGSGQTSAEIEQVVEAWNAMATRTGLSRIVKLNPARRRATRARLAEYGLQTMLDSIGRIERSDFCRGKAGGWAASFDFLVSDGKFLKLLEGTYDNRGATNTVGIRANRDMNASELRSAIAFAEDNNNPDRAAELKAQLERMTMRQPPGEIGAIVRQAAGSVRVDAR